jgi:hypothetical protein
MLRISSSCWTTTIRSSRLTVFWKFGSNAPVKKSKPDDHDGLECDGGAWNDWEAYIKMLITLTEKSSEQQLNAEIRGWLLAMGRFWRRKKSALFHVTYVLDFFKSSLGTCASPHVLLDTGGYDPDVRPTVK